MAVAVTGRGAAAATAAGTGGATIAGAVAAGVLVVVVVVFVSVGLWFSGCGALSVLGGTAATGSLISAPAAGVSRTRRRLLVA